MFELVPFDTFCDRYCLQLITNSLPVQFETYFWYKKVLFWADKIKNFICVCRFHEMSPKSVEDELMKVPAEVFF